MAKRRIPKVSKRRLTILGPISLIAILYFCFSLFYNAYNIYNLTNQKNELEDLYVQLQENAEDIKIYIEKLSDSEYLANYAREHYGYTTGGEYKIEFDLDSVEEDVDTIQNTINKNYVILALSGLMILIFVYILKKGKKKTRKK